MKYQQALDYLYSFLDSERKLPRTPLEFNLPRTAALLHTLGDPQQSFRSVVIAGTKGKGSTAAMLESIGRAAGYRTGLWTSPHLHSYRERIQVDRQLISQDELAALVSAARPLIEGFDTSQYGGLTTFELGFALALRFFAERQVELAVLEVGLGGRYDSANTIIPLLSVITSISYDHMHILGNTLAQIAGEKAGIIKAGVPVITVPQQPEAMAVIEQVAYTSGAALFVASGDDRIHLEHKGAGALEEQPAVLSSGLALPPLALGGVFQRQNAALAAGAALLLCAAGLHISDVAIDSGLAGAQWPGRMEIIAGEPPIVLDGAHNGDSAQKLAESLQASFPGRRLVLVLGVSAGHDVGHIMGGLLPVAAALVLTRSRHPRAIADLDGLTQQARALLGERVADVPIVTAEDVPPALELARSLAAPGDLICVTGSLFVVAAAREALGLAEPD